MSLSWPGTTCLLKHCTSLGLPNYFEIHGLWPDGKMNCKKVNWKENELSQANHFDIPKYWNWMYNSEMGFINHELAKHGSCWNPSEADLNKAPRNISKLISSSDTSSFHSVLNTYLQVPITWSKDNNLFQILANQGITPTFGTVSTQEVISAFENHFKVKNSIFPVCISNKNKKHYFSEIRFCLDKNYQLVSCDPRTVTNHINSCTKQMLYPEFPSLNQHYQAEFK